MRLPIALALLLGSCSIAPPRDSPVPPEGPLADLAFLTGHWISVGEGPQTEEIWGAPLGDSMVGVSAIRVDGTNVLTEAVAIEHRDDGVVLVLRHFDRGLTPWESERAPEGALVYHLVTREPDRVAFEDPTRREHDRLVYAAADDRLEVRLESTDGTPPLVFSFTR